MRQNKLPHSRCRCDLSGLSGSGMTGFERPRAFFIREGRFVDEEIRPLRDIDRAG